MNITTTERYQAFAEATLHASANECSDLHNYMIAQSGSMTSDELGLALETIDQCQRRIKKLDPAEITCKVMDVMYGGTPPMMTTTPPTVEGWYWIDLGDEIIPCFICMEDGDMCCEVQHSVISMTAEHWSNEGAKWSVDPITPPSDTALSLHDQYICVAEATIEAVLADTVSASRIKRIDCEDIVRNVLSLLAESPDNPGAPVDMGDA